MMMRIGLLAVALGACGDGGESADAIGDGEVGEVGEVTDPDRQDPTCQGAERVVPETCGAGVVTEQPNRGQDHVRDGVAIPAYEDVPPSSGDHRPSWAKWGEYSYLPPQRWLHNLEHGGIAFLYDPCVPEAQRVALLGIAKAQAGDDAGLFRWVMTPYPGLPTPVAVVAWQHTWTAECIDVAYSPFPAEGPNRTSLSTFITEHYRKAPEDVAVDGTYATDWIGR